MSVLAPLLPDPGVVREGTRYTAENRWYDCNRIRWRKGLPEKMGGWVSYGGNHIGRARALHDWGTVFGDEYLAVGTNSRLYIHSSGAYNDITPKRVLVTLAANWADVDATTGLVQITAPSNGVVVGDYISITTVQATLGGIPQARWNNQLHRVQQITGTDLLTIRIPAEAGDTPVTGLDGTVSDTVQTYLRTGSSIYTPGPGWGEGAWGSGLYAGTGSRTSTAASLRLWSLDNFGNDLLACPRGGDVYYWDQSDGLSSSAFPLSEGLRRTSTTLPGAFSFTSGSTSVIVSDTDNRVSVGETVVISGLTSGVDADIEGVPLSELNATHTVVSRTTPDSFEIAVTTPATGTGTGGDTGAGIEYYGSGEWSPVAALQVMTSPTARHVICFGANLPGETDTSNLYVRWSDSENPYEWRPTDTNTAGDFPLSAGAVLIGAIRTRQEIIIFTDENIVSMRYVGAPTVFAFVEIGSGISMISQNATVNAGGVTYFMDSGGFYSYKGDIQPLICDVEDYVFSRLDFNQANKIFAGANVDQREVMWFYPSVDGDGEVDSYVKYNYEEGLWDIGEMVRGAWAGGHVLGTPRSTSLLEESSGVSVEMVDASRTATLTYPNHRLADGDMVRLSASTPAPTAISQIALLSEHKVTSVISDSQVEINLPAAATADETVAVTVSPRNVLYEHEVGWDDDGREMGEWIESGENDIEDGHRFWFLNRFIPDIKFFGPSAGSGSVNVKMRGRDFPGEDQAVRVDVTVTPTTKQNHIRFRARQLSLRVAGVGTGFGWRFGKFRLGARADGRR